MTILWGPKSGRPRMERVWPPRKPVQISTRRRPRPPFDWTRAAAIGIISTAEELSFWWEEKKHAVYMEKHR